MTGRPRVAVVAPSLAARGGTESIVAGELTALCAVADVTVVTQEPATPGPRMPFARVIALPPGHLPEPWRLLRWFALATRTLATLGADHPIRYAPGMNAYGVTHCEVHAVFADLAAQMRGLPRAPTPRLRVQGWRFGAIARREAELYRNTDVRLATVSRTGAAMLARYYGRAAVTVLPPAQPDAGRFAPEQRRTWRAATRARLGLGDEARLVLAVGNAVVNKGLDVLLRAVAALNDPAVHLVVVSNQRRRDARVLAGTEPPRLQWLATVDDIAPLYAAADVLALPSRGETFGLPAVEAAALGVAVLASNRCGAAEVLPAAAIVPDLAPAAWTERLRSLCGDEAARAALAAACARSAGSMATPAARAQRFLDWLLGGSA